VVKGSGNAPNITRAASRVVGCDDSLFRKRVKPLKKGAWQHTHRMNRSGHFLRRVGVHRGRACSQVRQQARVRARFPQGVGQPARAPTGSGLDLWKEWPNQGGCVAKSPAASRNSTRTCSKRHGWHLCTANCPRRVAPRCGTQDHTVERLWQRHTLAWDLEKCTKSCHGWVAAKAMQNSRALTEWGSELRIRMLLAGLPIWHHVLSPNVPSPAPKEPGTTPDAMLCGAISIPPLSQSGCVLIGRRTTHPYLPGRRPPPPNKAPLVTKQRHSSDSSRLNGQPFLLRNKMSARIVAAREQDCKNREPGNE